MVLGSGLSGTGGAVLLYRSTDLKTWEYLGVLYQKNKQTDEPNPTGTMWECPAFFQLESKWVLIISALAPEGPLGVFYFVGEYQNNCFQPDGPAQMLDFGAGSCFYAPQTFLDEHGQRIMLGWLRESRTSALQIKAGWSGAMSLPRVLSLGQDGQLICTPLESLSTLRQAHSILERPNSHDLKAPGACFELCIKIPCISAAPSGARLSIQNASKSLTILYDPQKQIVMVDAQQAGGLISQAPFQPRDRSELCLRCFIDASVLEVFIDDQIALSARFYINTPQALSIYNLGDAHLELWKLDQ
jgi:beta-fructofuranosidase